MFIIKNILVKACTSLFVGAASAIGIKLANTAWDKCLRDEISKKKEQTST